MKNIFRKSRLVLVLLLLVGVLFGICTSTTNNAVAASDVNYDEELYKLSYSDDSIKLLLSTDFSGYLDITREDLSTLKNAIKDVLIQAITSDIDLSKYGENKKARFGKLFTGVEPTFGDSVDVSTLINILKSQLTSVEKINEDFLGGTTYDLMIEYYIDNYSTAYAASKVGTPQATTKEAVLDLIETELTTALQAHVQNEYGKAMVIQEVTDDAVSYVATKVNTLVSDVKTKAGLGQKVTVTLPDVKEIINKSDVSDYAVDYVKTSGMNVDVNEIIMAATNEEITEFLTEIDTDTLIDLAKETEIIDGDDVLEIINTIGVDNVIAIADGLTLDKLADLAQAVNLTKDEVTEAITNNMDQVSVGTMLKLLKGFYIDGNLIYSKENGIVVDGVKSFISSLPRPSEIQNYTDEQMKFSWDVKVTTSFGDIETSLTVGFFGDCGKIRRLAQILADHVSVYNDNGTYTVELIGPAKTGEIIAKFLNKDYISDELKQRVFEDLGSSVDTVYNRFNDAELDEYIDLLKQVDYKGIFKELLDGETLSNYLGFSITNSQIDSAIDFVIKVARKLEDKSYADILAFLDDYIDVSKLENEKIESLFNYFVKALNKIDDGTLSSTKIREWLNSETTTNESVYTRIDKLANYESYFDKLKSYVTRVYDRLPERYKEKTIVEYYSEENVWDLSARINVVKAIELLPQELEDGINVLLDRIPEYVNVRFVLTLPDVYKITYVYGNKTKVGFLPAGAMIDEYHGVVKVNGIDLQGWEDENGDEITVMPARDCTVTALAEYIVTISEGVNRTYDPNTTSKIEVSVNPTGDYTYQWYKDGEAVTGATNNYINVINVLDSGEYYCVVSTESGDVTSDTVTVAIAKAQLDISTIAWQQNVKFEFDGTQHELPMVGSYDTEKISISRSKFKQTYAGKYTATATFKLKSAYADNYEIVGSVADTEWEVTKLTIDVSEYQWPTTKSYVYTGEAIVHRLVSEISPFLNATYKKDADNKYYTSYTGVAKLKAAVEFAVSNSKYTNSVIITGSVAEDNWEITPMIIDVSGYTWSTPNQFTYDSAEKTVEIVTVPYDKFTIAYTDNVKTAAGSYKAVATITSSTKNIQPSSKTLELNWSIAKKVVDVTGYVWTTQNEFVYDGTEKSVTLTSKVNSGLNVTYTDNVKTNAGSYKAVATFTSKDPSVEANAEKLELNWSIAKVDFDMSGAYWKYTKAYTYTGSEQKVEIVGLPEGLTATYTDNAKTNAGTYKAKAVLVYDAANYNTPSFSLEKDWEIKKATFDLTNTKWNYTNEFVYDGTEKKIEIINLPAGLTVSSYTNNTATNAGMYTAKAVLAYDTANYNAPTIGDEIWEIKKATFDLSNVKWNYEAAYTYDKAEHTVALNALPQGLEVTYTDNAKTNAGKYNAVAKFALNNNNYNLPADLTLAWEIKPIEIDVTGYVWQTELEFTYDGKGHTVVLTSEIDSMLEPHYINNSKRDIGTYVAKVSYMLKHEALENYTIVGVTPDCEWTIKAGSGEEHKIVHEFEPFKVGDIEVITINSEKGISDEYDLSVSRTLEYPDVSNAVEGKECKAYEVYDIHFEKDGNETLVKGDFTVRMLIPEEIRNKANLAVIHIDDDNNITIIDSVRDGDYLVFDAAGFSMYAIIHITEAPSIIILIVCGILALLLIIAVISYFAKKKEDEDGNIDPFFIKLASCSPEIKSCYYQLKAIVDAYEDRISRSINAYVETFSVNDETIASIEVKNAKLVVRANNKKVVVKDSMSSNKGKKVLEKALRNADFSK